jgi:hypothetical protein
MESLDHTNSTEDFSAKEEEVLEINSRTKVFDQDILTHVLQYLNTTQRILGTTSSIKMRTDDDIVKIAVELFKHSKKLEH